MIKKILFSTLFMMIGYCSFGQSGQYLAILEDGWCLDPSTGTYSWIQNPKIIVIDPNGTITETPLTAANSVQDVIEHTAEFNVTVSQIMNLGYTINPSGSYNTAGAYAGGIQAASSLQWSDSPCNLGSSGFNLSVVSLIPCCTPP
ncbi:hypothetical protein N8Z75_00135 [Crocinitomicaceae bacterium]|nr:hypothetical protein [Crocinitomicaceae bacterium]